MVCSDYYTTHPSLTDPTIDRCIRDDIAAGTAAQFSILGITTTLCGTISLFAAGWTTKRFGPRLALMVHVFVTAIRVLTQILGVKAGGKTGIIVFQCTQLITVVAAPGGYMSVLFSFAVSCETDVDSWRVDRSSKSLLARSSIQQDKRQSFACYKSASCWVKASESSVCLSFPPSYHTYPSVF
jgi:hypothetical protein